MKVKKEKSKLYIVLISIHGLIRSHDLELGRDADTGGQTLYVTELARALAAHPNVECVDLLTRRIFDPKVDSEYQKPIDYLSPHARLVRLDCGPRRYLRKEVLWPYLDAFIDKSLQHIRSVGRVPDIIHSHYADAGLAGSQLAGLLGIPFVYTGHSLGHDKLNQLLNNGIKPETIESRYNISQRIEAEEVAIGSAAMVVASTHQEVNQQYACYDNYQTKRMSVIPPGVDLSRFHPPVRGDRYERILTLLKPFLNSPKKPMIVAVSRADERKNISSLIRAYGESSELQSIANLIIIAGNREDISALDKGARDVLTDILMLIDRYNLYGKVAYPKQHQQEDIPALHLRCLSGCRDVPFRFSARTVRQNRRTQPPCSPTEILHRFRRRAHPALVTRLHRTPFASGQGRARRLVPSAPLDQSLLPTTPIQTVLRRHFHPERHP